MVKMGCSISKTGMSIINQIRRYYDVLLKIYIGRMVTFVSHENTELGTTICFLLIKVATCKTVSFIHSMIRALLHCVYIYIYIH